MSELLANMSRVNPLGPGHAIWSQKSSVNIVSCNGLLPDDKPMSQMSPEPALSQDLTGNQSMLI